MEQQITADVGIQSTAYIIAGWSVDLTTLRIHKGDKSVKLEPKVMAVLEYLAARPGQVVSRHELENSVWSGTVVGYDAISNAIIKLRKAFGDSAQHAEIIETIPKTGYRLIAPIESGPEARVQTSEADIEVGQNQSPVVEAPTDDLPRPVGWKVITSISAPLMVLISLVSLWVQPWVSKVEPASLERMELPFPDGPSIAVLPFANLSANSQYDYFVDGITEDLITDLSKLPGLFVVARHSMFTYKGRDVGAREVSEELGVGFVLKGSAERTEDQVRINVQLIDALLGVHKWAERYVGQSQDIGTLRDRMSADVREQLSLKLKLEEKPPIATDRTTYADTYELYLRGWGHYRAGSASDYSIAIQFFKQALERDPEFYRAEAAITAVYWNILTQGLWQESLEVDYYDAFELTRRSLRRSQKNPTALTHQIASEWITYYARGGRAPSRALEAAEAALSIDPNNPAGYLAKASALLKDNKALEAQLEIRKAMRFDPHFPPEYLVRLAQTQIQLGEYQAAVESLNQAVASNPGNSWAQLYLAVAYGLLNRQDEARATFLRANQLRAEDGWGEVTIVATAHPYFRWQGNRDKLKQGLLEAGAKMGGEWFNLISYTAIGKANEVEGATLVDVTEAKALHDRGAVFIHTQPTWRNGHIPGAHFLYWWGEGWLFNEVSLQRLIKGDAEVVIYSYDSKGKNTAHTAAFAVSRGFKNIYQFPGGLDDWTAAGYPVIKAQ